MTNATTTTTVRLVRTFEGTGSYDTGGNNFIEGTENRLWQTQDGHRYVLTSWSPFGPDSTGTDVEAHAMAWEVDDPETGEPAQTYMFEVMLAGAGFDERNYYVDGDNTDETHYAALAQRGYSVEQSEEDAA